MDLSATTHSTPRDHVAATVELAGRLARERAERERQASDPLTKLRMQVNFITQAIQTVLLEIDRLDEEVEAGEFSHYRHTAELTDLEYRLSFLEIHLGVVAPERDVA